MAEFGNLDLSAYDWDEVHEQIVKESFTGLTEPEAVALLGVLNEYRIDFSQALRSIVEPVEGWAPASEVPLTLRAAAALISRIHGLDARDLLTTYRQAWREIRDGPTVRSVVERLEEHRFVGKLVPYSDLP